MAPFSVNIDQTERPFLSAGFLHKFVNEFDPRDVPIVLTVAGPWCQGRHPFKSTDELKDFVRRMFPLV